MKSNNMYWQVLTKSNYWERVPKGLFEQDLTQALQGKVARGNVKAYAIQLKVAYLSLAVLAKRKGRNGKSPVLYTVGFTRPQLANLWNVSVKTAKRLVKDLIALNVLQWQRVQWRNRTVNRSMGSFTVDIAALGSNTLSFTPVPRAAVFDEDLSLEAKYVYFHFVRNGIHIAGQPAKYPGMTDIFQNPIIYTSWTQLKKQFGLGRVAAQSVLTELATGGWIRWVGPSPQGGIYAKLLPIWGEAETFHDLYVRIGATKLLFSCGTNSNRTPVKKNTVSGTNTQGYPGPNPAHI